MCSSSIVPNLHLRRCYENAWHDLTVKSVQAWPQDAPESLARKSWSSDSQAPIKEAGQDTSMAAEIAHNKDDPRHTELQVSMLSHRSCSGSLCGCQVAHMCLELPRLLVCLPRRRDAHGPHKD